MDSGFESRSPARARAEAISPSRTSTSPPTSEQHPPRSTGTLPAPWMVHRGSTQQMRPPVPQVYAPADRTEGHDSAPAGHSQHKPAGSLARDLLPDQIYRHHEGDPRPRAFSPPPHHPHQHQPYPHPQPGRSWPYTRRDHRHAAYDPYSSEHSPNSGLTEHNRAYQIEHRSTSGDLRPTDPRSLLSLYSERDSAQERHEPEASFRSYSTRQSSHEQELHSRDYVETMREDTRRDWRTVHRAEAPAQEYHPYYAAHHRSDLHRDRQAFVPEAWNHSLSHSPPHAPYDYHPRSSLSPQQFHAAPSHSRWQDPSHPPAGLDSNSSGQGRVAATPPDRQHSPSATMTFARELSSENRANQPQRHHPYRQHLAQHDHRSALPEKLSPSPKSQQVRPSQEQQQHHLWDPSRLSHHQRHPQQQPNPPQQHPSYSASLASESLLNEVMELRRQQHSKYSSTDLDERLRRHDHSAQERQQKQTSPNTPPTLAAASSAPTSASAAISVPPLLAPEGPPAAPEDYDPRRHLASPPPHFLHQHVGHARSPPTASQDRAAPVQARPGTAYTTQPTLAMSFRVSRQSTLPNMAQASLATTEVRGREGEGGSPTPDYDRYHQHHHRPEWDSRQHQVEDQEETMHGASSFNDDPYRDRRGEVSSGSFMDGAFGEPEIAAGKGSHRWHSQGKEPAIYSDGDVDMDSATEDEHPLQRRGDMRLAAQQEQRSATLKSASSSMSPVGLRRDQIFDGAPRRYSSDEIARAKVEEQESWQQQQRQLQSHQRQHQNPHPPHAQQSQQHPDPVPEELKFERARDGMGEKDPGTKFRQAPPSPHLHLPRNDGTLPPVPEERLRPLSGSPTMVQEVPVVAVAVTVAGDHVAAVVARDAKQEDARRAAHSLPMTVALIPVPQPVGFADLSPTAVSSAHPGQAIPQRDATFIVPRTLPTHPPRVPSLPHGGTTSASSVLSSPNSSPLTNQHAGAIITAVPIHKDIGGNRAMNVLLPGRRPGVIAEPGMGVGSGAGMSSPGPPSTSNSSSSSSSSSSMSSPYPVHSIRLGQEGYYRIQDLEQLYLVWRSQFGPQNMPSLPQQQQLQQQLQQQMAHQKEGMDGRDGIAGRGGGGRAGAGRKVVFQTASDHSPGKWRYDNVVEKDYRNSSGSGSSSTTMKDDDLKKKGKEKYKYVRPLLQSSSASERVNIVGTEGGGGGSGGGGGGGGDGGAAQRDVRTHRKEKPKKQQQKKRTDGAMDGATDQQGMAVDGEGGEEKEEDELSSDEDEDQESDSEEYSEEDAMGEEGTKEGRAQRGSRRKRKGTEDISQSDSSLRGAGGKDTDDGTSGSNTARRNRVRESKNHWCEQCGKRFSRPSQLMTHSFTHSGEKPHQCPMCQKYFNVASNLKRHIRTHANTKRKSSRNGSTVFRSFAHGFLIKQSHGSSSGTNGTTTSESGAGAKTGSGAGVGAGARGGDCSNASLSSSSTTTSTTPVSSTAAAMSMGSARPRRTSSTVLQPLDRLRWMNTETPLSGSIAASHQTKAQKQQQQQQQQKSGQSSGSLSSASGDSGGGSKGLQASFNSPSSSSASSNTATGASGSSTLSIFAPSSTNTTIIPTSASSSFSPSAPTSTAASNPESPNNGTNHSAAAPTATPAASSSASNSASLPELASQRSAITQRPNLVGGSSSPSPSTSTMTSQSPLPAAAQEPPETSSSTLMDVDPQEGETSSSTGPWWQQHIKTNIS